jgi:hypothetical protein
MGLSILKPPMSVVICHCSFVNGHLSSVHCEGELEPKTGCRLRVKAKNMGQGATSKHSSAPSFTTDEVGKQLVIKGF